MTLGAFLNLLAASLGALGSVYVLRSYLVMTPELTADIATPRWDYSLSIVDSMAQQRAESVTGAVVFIAALVVAVGALLVPSSDTPLFTAAWQGVLFAAICVPVTWAGIHKATRHLTEAHKADTRRVLLSRRLDRAFAGQSEGSGNLEDLILVARHLAQLELSLDMPAEDILSAVARAVGRKLPAGTDTVAAKTKPRSL